MSDDGFQLDVSPERAGVVNIPKHHLWLFVELFAAAAAVSEELSDGRMPSDDNIGRLRDRVARGYEWADTARMLAGRDPET
jgi:hypothetical protein